MTSPIDDAFEEVVALLDEYKQFLSGKAQGTTDAYLRTVRQVMGWVAQLPGNAGRFQPLYDYLQAIDDPTRIYVFTSRRSERLTEEAIHYWFRKLKAQGTQDQREVIEALTFYDLRYDFAHRAREAGWTLEEVASYLGLAAKQGALPTFW
jgi:integrase